MGSMNLGARHALRRATHGAAPQDEDDDDTSDLLSQMGGEVATTLSAALERVNALATTGRIDRLSLQALRDEIALARRIGMMGQQVSRFAAGRMKLTREQMDLGSLLREAMDQRSREIEARGIEVRQVLQPACVMGDPTLTFALIETLFDWSFEHGRSRIDFLIDHKPWPAHARLHCAFAHQPADEVTSAPMPLDQASLETMSWRLLEQTAFTLGLPLARDSTGGRTQVCIEFPATVGDRMEGVSAIELDGHTEQHDNSRPLAGNHVLVMAARREVRNIIREAVRPMGLMVDFVTSVEEAREFCRGGMPHAVVHEAQLGGDAFEALRRELLGELPRLAFIQITDDSTTFEVRHVGDRQHASVGRAAIMQSLPAALLFELSRS